MATVKLQRLAAGNRNRERDSNARRYLLGVAIADAVQGGDATEPEIAIQ
jgi:hypothetical protein